MTDRIKEMLKMHSGKFKTGIKVTNSKGGRRNAVIENSGLESNKPSCRG